MFTPLYYSNRKFVRSPCELGRGYPRLLASKNDVSNFKVSLSPVLPTHLMGKEELLDLHIVGKR